MKPSNFFLLFFSLIFYSSLNIPSLHGSSMEEFPVLHKGRFRPADAYARLWLHDIYHSQMIKSDAISDFSLNPSSALYFLWTLNFFGHEHYRDLPLFWIKLDEIKSLSGLDLSKERFSYEELVHAFYHQTASAEAVVKKLANYYFWQTHFNSSNHSSKPIEIASLLPGLWMQWRDGKIIVVLAPANSPWPFLKKGFFFETFANLEDNKKIIFNDQKFAEEQSRLLISLKEFENLQKWPVNLEQSFLNRMKQLQMKQFQPKEIANFLEQEFPLVKRLQDAGSLFKSLPSRFNAGDWFPLQSLKVQVFDSLSNGLRPVDNFTLFSDTDFESIRHAYLDLEENMKDRHHKELLQDKLHHFSTVLQQAYTSLVGETYQEAHGKQLKYPTFVQLKMEYYHHKFPWVRLLILLYSISACLWIIPRLSMVAMGLTVFAILCHTFLLAMRCCILERPPVSNMYETVLYVPWISSVATLVYSFFHRQKAVVLGACLTSIILLFILELTNLNQSLEHVQAVLDSQFWLMIHVLLVVGSYGIFILGGALAHFYLAFFIQHRLETPFMRSLAKLILQTMYLGTTLLIVGTILGGIWAAESWGRFWDWDPKESWAFISICYYLIWIHAYLFNRIESFGLAIGAVSGLLAISFTWYGVNYILGTGLHSYGFGSGGEIYYIAFVITEVLFLAFSLWLYSRQGQIKRIND